MVQMPFRCNENDWIISKNQDITIESPPLINSKAILFNGKSVHGMLHISNDFGIKKIDNFLDKIKSQGEDLKSDDFKIAMKTINVDYESDKDLLRISKKLNYPIEKIHYLVIPTDSKKIVTMKINKKEENIELF